MGILQFNRNTNERAKDELKHILQLLDNYLRTRTYLVGERITLADITIACDLLLLFQWVRELKKILADFYVLFRLLNQVYVKHIQM
jgi:elongation factor 1-gamma